MQTLMCNAAQEFTKTFKNLWRHNYHACLCICFDKGQVKHIPLPILSDRHA